MSESAARENQGAPNDLEERQKLERVLHDELAQLRDKQCEERRGLEFGQYELAPSGDGRVGLLFWLTIGAVGALYFLSELFVSKQLILQLKQNERQVEPNEPQADPSKPYGAGQPGYVAKGLLLPYLAACLATIAFVAGKPPAFSDWQRLLLFALAGAVLWGVPCLIACLIASERQISLLFTRFVSGAGFGVVLFFCAALLHYLGVLNERYVTVFGIAVFFLAHLAGCILFSGLTSVLQICDDLREWSARASGWFLVIGLIWTIYAFLVLWDPNTDWPGPITSEWKRNLLHLLVTSGGTIAGIAAALFGSSPSTAALQGHRASTPSRRP
jgi:hypothetical protein